MGSSPTSGPSAREGRFPSPTATSRRTLTWMVRYITNSIDFTTQEKGPQCNSGSFRDNPGVQDRVRDLYEEERSLPQSTGRVYVPGIGPRRVPPVQPDHGRRGDSNDRRRRRRARYACQTAAVVQQSGCSKAGYDHGVSNPTSTPEVPRMRAERSNTGKRKKTKEKKEKKRSECRACVV